VIVKIPFFQIDAFTSTRFTGNPAAVCVLGEWLADERLQAIARENNLSETAFLVRGGSGFRLRWFTPTVEVDLCGHATLASAFAVFKELEPASSQVSFDTRSGVLSVTRDGDWLSMDFPSRPPTACATPPQLDQAFPGAIVEVLAADDYLVVLRDAEAVRTAAPDPALLRELDRRAVCITAQGEGCDFVSRFFAPKCGVDEDPVTGSAHCMLTPFWSRRLQRRSLDARQLSARGGEIRCEDRGERVLLSGRAVAVIGGTMWLD
jgi:predicted PhzF superfamily epimerase YddE/YHI9